MFLKIFRNNVNLASILTIIFSLICFSILVIYAREFINLQGIDAYGWIYLGLLFVFFVPFSFMASHYFTLMLLSTSYYYFKDKKQSRAESIPTSSVAILYATCNDFDPVSLQSCITQDFGRFNVYVLDDSSLMSKRAEIDDFVDSARLNSRCGIYIVRRENRNGAKAGNINNSLQFINEDYCVICDADQVLMPNFCTEILAHIVADDNLAYVQGLHCAREGANSLLPRMLNYGIYLFWGIVLPVRMAFGFPMFLGHGGIIKTSILKSIKFPEVVAEDLAFSVACYDAGYIGKYADNVFSYEAFPESVRDFRKRHMKWVRGTCEFLRLFSSKIISSKNLEFRHKWDIFLSLIQVPFGFVFIIFSVVNFFFLYHYWLNPDVNFPLRFEPLFFSLACLISISPFLPFAVPLIIKRRFIQLFVFYTLGIAIYVATLPITFFGMIGYFYDKKADFITTGDSFSDTALSGFRNPNSLMMFFSEIAVGCVFVFFGSLFKILGVIGLGLSFLLFPLLCVFDLTRRNVVFAMAGPILTIFSYFIFTYPSFG